MLYLEALNEKGTVCWRDSEAGVLEFRYSNQFCGSCRFLGRVIESPDRGLSFADEDLVWEDFSLRRGNSRVLYKNALVFFEQYLRRQRSVEKFHRQVSRPSGHGLRERIRRLLGKGATSPPPAPGENGHKSENMTGQCEDREEGGLHEYLNGNGSSKEELPVLELDLKGPSGAVSFDLDLPTRRSRPQSFSLEPEENGERGNKKPDPHRDRRTPMLPFVD